MRAPQKQQARKQTQGVAVTPINNGGFRIRHSEYCGTVDSLTAIPNTQSGLAGSADEGLAKPIRLSLNPGDGVTFPWLTGIAARFEKYRFRSLRFRYVPTISTLFAGSVSMCPIYDPSESVPRDRRALYNAEGTRTTVVYQPMSMQIPTVRLNQTLFVRLSHPASLDNTELRQTDLGYVAVSLMDIGGVDLTFGSLFVDYEVDLIMPRVGARTPKTAHYVSELIDHNAVLTTRPALFGDNVSGTKHDLNHRRYDGTTGTSTHGHNKHSTLALTHSFMPTGYYRDYSTDEVEASVFTFDEPFAGVLTVKHDSSGAFVPYEPNYFVNGIRDTTGTQGWSLSGSAHPIKAPKLSLIERISNGVDKAISTFKVIAETGEAIAIALDNTVAAVGGKAEILLTEAEPELLELAGLV